MTLRFQLARIDSAFALDHLPSLSTIINHLPNGRHPLVPPAAMRTDWLELDGDTRSGGVIMASDYSYGPLRYDGHPDCLFGLRRPGEKKSRTGLHPHPLSRLSVTCPNGSIIVARLAASRTHMSFGNQNVGRSNGTRCMPATESCS